MIDFDAFSKSGTDMIKALKDMQDAMSRNMQEISTMPEAKPVMDKMDLLHKHMKAGNLKGVMAIQEELLKMKEEIENDASTDHSNG